MAIWGSLAKSKRASYDGKARDAAASVELFVAHRERQQQRAAARHGRAGPVTRRRCEDGSAM